ncbi:hypothetical protein [Pseudotamlana agarivorans]|uniref:hypothetical protein n=1 Tax=Pseudotamlana agarivorans TaxID=481183 RepID=UPI000A43A351|nr:hypothetical protein [Tamlana agarivorans]
MKNLNKTTVKVKSSSLFFRTLKLLMITCVSGCFLLSSCGKDDVVDALGIGGCDGSNWEDQYGNAIEDLSQASANLSNNPSVQSCNEYKAAVLRYYDALEDIYDCIPIFDYGYDEAVQQAKKELDAIDCSDYN